MHELKFTNTDATPKVVSLSVDKASVAPIMTWYGSHFAGDRYTVTLDGERLKKDRNGELVGTP